MTVTQLREPPLNREIGKEIFEMIAQVSISNCLLEMRADKVASGWLWPRDYTEAASWVWADLTQTDGVSDEAISVTATAEPNEVMVEAFSGIGIPAFGYRTAERLYRSVQADIEEIAAAVSQEELETKAAFMWFDSEGQGYWSHEASDATGIAVVVCPDDDPKSVLCRLVLMDAEVDTDRLLALADQGDIAALLVRDTICYGTPTMEDFAQLITL